MTLFVIALPGPPTPPPDRKYHHKYQELVSTLSTLYAKLLVVVGVAIPVTAGVGKGVPPAFDQVCIYMYIHFLHILGTEKSRGKASGFRIRKLILAQKCEFN